jgi:hypothetical protein
MLERARALVVCLTLGLFGVAALAQRALIPVDPRSPPIKVIGYEVSPPQGSHWFIDSRNEPGWITFRKQDSARQSVPNGELLSLVVEIKAERYPRHDLTTPAGLEEALKYALYEKPEAFRYSSPRFDHYPWQGTHCIRYSMTRERAELVNGESIPWVWSVEGFFCRHPDSPTIAVTGFFQERRPAQTPSLLDEGLRKEAQDVLDSIRFVKSGLR